MDHPTLFVAPRPEESPESALAPALAAHGPIPADTDGQLARIAIRARDGDPRALDALYSAFLPRIDHWIRRAQHRLRWNGSDPALEPDDIAQQAFIVFADLIRAWHGRDSLSAYVIAYFDWRLKNAIRDQSDRRGRVGLDQAPISLLQDGSHDADEALLLLDQLASRLPSRQRTILLLRVRDDLPWTEVARRAGVPRRTALRDWRSIRQLLLSEFLIEL